MNPQPYTELSDLTLLELCVWREAQNQGHEGMRAVAWSIRNRIERPCWWSESKQPMPSLWHAVILKPWQYSSFNLADPNNRKFPSDVDPFFATACDVCTRVYVGSDTDDLTDGATHYYDTSIGFPKAWGSESEWINTLNVGKLRFWKMRPVNNHEAVQDAVTGEG